MNLEIDRFTAAESEAITGVSQDNVRNWRRQGYLPPIKGHARFDVFDLAMISVMGSLSDRNIGPRVATPFAKEAATAIFQRITWSPESYEPEAVTSATALSAQFTSDALISDFLENTALTDAQVREDFIRIQAEAILSKAACALIGLPDRDLPSWAIARANGTLEFLDELSPLEDLRSDAPILQGPLLLLSLGAQASKLLKALPRPAFTLREAA